MLPDTCCSLLLDCVGHVERDRYFELAGFDGRRGVGGAGGSNGGRGDRLGTAAAFSDRDRLADRDAAELRELQRLGLHLLHCIGPGESLELARIVDREADRLDNSVVLTGGGGVVDYLAGGIEPAHLYG